MKVGAEALLVAREPFPGRGAALGRLSSLGALVLEGAVPEVQARGWAAAVLAAEARWNRDFGGEQYSLGRAWYTHREAGLGREYFAGAAASDALVERVLPGFQQRMRSLVAVALGVEVVARRGWCGAGIHVFPPGGVVAKRGGVIHFDTEGLPARHLESRRAAVTALLALQPAERGGGLRVWDRTWSGEGHVEVRPGTARRAEAAYRPGDLVLMSSYRLHQIEPFQGPAARITATLHLAEVDPGRWESWF